MAQPRNISSYMKRQKENRRQTKRLFIGITGGLASGKSTVTSFLKRLGAYVVDADKIAHSILKPGSVVYNRLIRSFGKDILKSGRSINRKALAKRAFASPALARRLNNITHPEIIREINKQISQASGATIVLDAPLLIEAGLSRMVDVLIVVTAKRQQQIVRAMRKLKAPRAEIISIIKRQMPASEKVRRADFVIDNSQTKQDTRKQVKEVFQKLRRF